MDLIGIALMVFSMTLLTATVYYVITTTRHKERMALIERGEDVRKIFDQRTSLDALKIGMALVGAGIGFFTGVWLEDSRIFSSHIELPLYFAPIFIFTGLGLVIFYKMFGKQYKIPKQAHQTLSNFHFQKLKIMKSFSMNRTAMSALCGALLIFLSQALSAQGTNSSWLAYSAPEEGGFSTAKLNQAKAQFDSMSSPAFMVIHQGKVLVAWGDVSRRFLNHSMRKSLMSAMYGIYIEKGLIDLDKSLAELGIDDKLGLTDIEKQARVQDLITARSGIYHPAAYEPRSMKANRPQRGASRPGEKFNYNNWDFNTLLTILEQEARIKFFDEYYNQIANPLGMEDLRKQDMQYRYEPELSDHAAYLFKMSTRDLARFGQLYLDNGQWNGEQIIPAQWVKKSTAVFSDDLGPGFSNRDGYGYLWWVDLTSFGQTAYYASGLGGHRLYVLPESDMVIVHRVNSYLNMGERDENIKKLVSLVLDAQTGKSKPRPEVTPLQIDAPQMPSAAINENLMKSYHGHYTHPFFQAIEVYSDEGQLKIRGEILGTFNLYARDDSQFVVEDLPELPLSFAPATSEYPKGTATTLSDERRRPTRFILYY